MFWLACGLSLAALAAAPSNSNPSFEEIVNKQPVGWTSDDIQGARWEPTDAYGAYDGSIALRLRGVSSETEQRVRLVSDPIAVQGGDAIRFQAWTRANGSPRHNLHIYVEGRRGEKWERLEPGVDRPQSERWLRDQWVPQGYTTFVTPGMDAIRLVCAGAINSEIRVSWFLDNFTCEVISFADYLKTRAARVGERLPDIYLVSPDTLSQEPLGVYGARHNFTPHIDWLAEEGRVYDQVTTACPWTKPSFASIMTGLYPSQHTVQDVQYLLPEEAHTLAEYLRERGYFTVAAVWSAYDGYLGPYMQFDQGFDIYFNSDNERHVSDAVLQFLETNQQNLKDMGYGGVFVWHHIWEPHIPYTNRQPQLLSNPDGKLGPVDITGMVYRRIIWDEPEYYNPADMAYMQDVYRWEAVFVNNLIGKVFSRFHWAGLLDNLNVVFCSDHGESFEEKEDVWGHSHGYESCTRTPLIIRAPGRMPAGDREEEALVSNLDILPTLLDIAGVKPNSALPGRSLLNQDTDAYTARYGVSETRRHGYLTLRDQQYKIILKYASESLDDTQLDHRWNFCDGGGVYELYDIKADPTEQNNLADSLPDVLDRMKAALQAHIDTHGISCAEGGQGERGELDAGTLEQLEALGYLGGEGPPAGLEAQQKVTEGGFGNLGGL
jgi:arylsulfatase A-like enzyme